MFRWFLSIGLDEEAFRDRVYMAAVCRCFPGKNPKGGDRVPSKAEIASCARWLAAETALLEPSLILPVGKLAIAQLMGAHYLGPGYQLLSGYVVLLIVLAIRPQGIFGSV